MSESTRIQVRCDSEQKERWAKAAGGPRKMSAWAKEVLDREASGVTPTLSLDRFHKETIEDLIGFVSDGRYDLESAVFQMQANAERDALEEESGKALGETPDEATAQVAPEGLSSNVEEALWLRDGELNHMPGPNPGTQYTMCGLDAGTMRRVMIPVDHAGVWCHECLERARAEEDAGGTNRDAGSDPRPGEPDGSSSALDVIRTTEDAERAVKELGERAFPDTYRDVVEFVNERAAGDPALEERYTETFFEPIDVRRGREDYFDDDTNPEPEDPIEFTMLEPERTLTGEGGVEMTPLLDGVIAGKDTGRAPVPAPPSPPAVNALSPICTNAIMHWKLASGETCRFCGGTA